METRIEKYREYRKSIISGGDTFLKTPIETSLKTTSKESQTSPTEQEAVFLKKILHKGMITNSLYFLFLLVIIIPLIVFGIILF